jgi:creatinine amidohydrolase
MTPRRFWRDMAATDFAGDTANWIAVLPLAAIEQHGPHLPLGVDALIAEAMVARCADELPAKLPVTFLPVQQIAKSTEHARFDGTLALGWETTIQNWIDVGDSLGRSGIRKLVIVTSHGGNFPAMEIVALEMRHRHAMLCVTTSWERLGGYRGEETDIHGGHTETSLMLAVRPDLVNMKEAQDFASAQTPMKANNKRLGFHSSDANIAWLAGDLNSAGVTGNAATATAELGQHYLASAVVGFCELAGEIAATDPPVRG